MYLLLLRDLDKFKIAKTMVLNDEELWDAANSFIWVNDAVEYRVRDLEGAPQHSKLTLSFA